MNKREIALVTLKQSVGIPYKWGGNDPMSGFDCSGLVVEMLQSAGILDRNLDLNAHRLSENFPETEVLQPGVLVFYDWNNDGIIDHVEVVAFIDDSGEAYTIGASGGDSSTTTLNSAITNNAFVKIRPLIGGYKLAVDPF